MTDVIIVGAGGHAAEIDEYIEYSQKANGVKEFNIVGFLDDNPQNYKRYSFSAPLLGGIRDYKIKKGQAYIIGIANLKFRRVIIESFIDEGGYFVTFIHFGAYVSPSAKIGEGTIIGPNANIGPNVHIGRFNLLNSRSSLGHDTIIGDYNFISPNVCFSGFTEVGDENLFGINSATIPGFKVGNRNKIAAGMIIDRNIENDSVVFYRFREKVLAVPNQ